MLVCLCFNNSFVRIPKKYYLSLSVSPAEMCLTRSICLEYLSNQEGDSLTNIMKTKHTAGMKAAIRVTVCQGKSAPSSIENVNPVAYSASSMEPVNPKI